MITAILDAGILKGEVRWPNVSPSIDIILTLPIKISYQASIGPDTDIDYKIARFEWKEQLSKYKHRYTLKEII